MAESPKEELVMQFLDWASRGHLQKVDTMLSSSMFLLNARGHNGWTALMLAARNGCFDVVDVLLTKGCDKTLMNKSGQTAYDIAKFWGHKHIASVLAHSERGDGHMLHAKTDMVAHENYFSREYLDRMCEKRTDTSWLEAKQASPHSVFIVFFKLNPLVTAGPEKLWHEEQALTLCRLGVKCVQELLGKPHVTVVFLGVEKHTKPLAPSLGADADGLAAWFALSTDDDLTKKLKAQIPDGFFLRSAMPGLLKLNREEAGVIAQARSVLAWHSRYSFCPTCGNKTKIDEGGYRRTCLNKECLSLQGIHNTRYPRVDPVVIMLVIHPDGNQCLLGRKNTFPAGMFSCLAGFVEPGEAIEDAVRREVQEESRVSVGPVRYVCSQPWPMPSSLMIGCQAAALSTHIQVDGKEIEEARWFTRQQVIDVLCQNSQSAFTIPPEQAIAYQLLKNWIRMNANL